MNLWLQLSSWIGSGIKEKSQRESGQESWAGQLAWWQWPQPQWVPSPGCAQVFEEDKVPRPVPFIWKTFVGGVGSLSDALPGALGVTFNGLRAV